MKTLIKHLVILLLFLIVPILAASCEGSNSEAGDSDGDLDIEFDFPEVEYDDSWTPLPCNEIYDAGLLPTYELEISDEVLSQLEYLWQHAYDEVDPPTEPKEYLPIESFSYNDGMETISLTDVMIRLKGQPYNWVESPNKMQFIVSFDEIIHDQTFKGLRKLVLDAPYNDPSGLHERLAFYIIRESGLPATCANTARLMINGEYYGFFTNMERIDHLFIERNFGPEADGNLYKHDANVKFVFDKESNESDPDRSDITALINLVTRYEADANREAKSAAYLAELETILSIPNALAEWAAEAVLPDMDGFWVGGSNYLLYNDPEKRFLFIPYDLDFCFESANNSKTDPVDYCVGWSFWPLDVPPGCEKNPIFRIVMSNPEYREKYVDQIERMLGYYDPEDLTALIDTWDAQIASSIREDTRKPFSDEDHRYALKAIKKFITERYAFLKQWLEQEEESR